MARTGTALIFNDSENNAGVVDYAFCGRCGSTVYWTISYYPGLYSVALGCFEAESLPAPGFEHYDQYRQAWVNTLEHADRYPEFPPREVLEPKRLGSSRLPRR